MVVAVIAYIIAGYLYQAYRREKILIIYYFSCFYAYLGLFFLLVSFPLVSSNGYVIGFFNAVGFLFLFVALAYISFVSLSLLKWGEMAMVSFYFCILFGLFCFTVRLFYFSPSVSEVDNYFINWRPVFLPWLRSFTGFYALVIGVTTVIIFIMYGFRQKDNVVVFRRSLIIGAGLSLLSAAAVVGLLLSPYGQFKGELAGSIITILALLNVLRGITYRRAVADNIIESKT